MYAGSPATAGESVVAWPYTPSAGMGGMPGSGSANGFPVAPTAPADAGGADAVEVEAIGVDMSMPGIELLLVEEGEEPHALSAKDAIPTTDRPILRMAAILADLPEVIRIRT